MGNVLTNARAEGLGRAAVLQCKRGRRVFKRNPDPEGSGPQVANQYINHILEKVFPVPRIIPHIHEVTGPFCKADC